MKLTVKFTDVYDGEEHERVETIDVNEPSDLTFGDALDDWAYDEIFPHTGDGNAVDKDAGYFAEIIACDEAPGLVGQEFEWGV
ncbi:hypothetical protein K8O93_00990 [Gordonia bronchialis]|uniref:hypothetical protein n=1 Tax=Gordonia bronchialis TaxID=2054 RepID=UPI001CC03DFC|nr:hypothetical protein [Gordonia bronchialis]UAK38409.1 hypothetical protein K8O93_00990 [Gordonia bronchialis]